MPVADKQTKSARRRCSHEFKAEALGLASKLLKRQLAEKEEELAILQ